MKRKIALILALVLVFTSLMPVPALAAPKFEDFNAVGILTWITPGDVAPAGDSGRFRVIEREIDFYLLPGSSIVGPSVLIYKANVDLATQAGNFHGTLNAGGYTFQVNGTAEPLSFVGFSADGNLLFESRSSGHWTIVDGQGNGDFTATVVFKVDPISFHIVGVEGGSLEMTGKWKP